MGVRGWGAEPQPLLLSCSCASGKALCSPRDEKTSLGGQAAVPSCGDLVSSTITTMGWVHVACWVPGWLPVPSQ